MSSLTTSLRQALLAFVAFAAFVAIAPLAVVQAQPKPAVPPAVASADTAPAESRAATPTEGRRNQKIENIHVEDSGAKVDEKRFGGQTQSITVQPKGNVPGYQVLPNDGGRDRDGSAETSSGGNGPRVWNVMKF